MPTPQKICPQCQTPAPVSAGFCGGCGHRYRTQFAGASPTTRRLPLIAYLLVPLVAIGAFGLVMTLGRKPTPSPSDVTKNIPLSVRPPAEIEEPRATQPAPKEESDPLMREAQRALKNANQVIEEKTLKLGEDAERSRRSRSSGSSRGSVNNDPIILEGGR